jgi:hypothetical protein
LAAADINIARVPGGAMFGIHGYELLIIAAIGALMLVPVALLGALVYFFLFRKPRQ